MSEPSLLSTLRNRCPRCGGGRVMTGLLHMTERCWRCGLVYEQEAGQYIGATVISYLVGAAFALPVFFGLLMHRLPAIVVLGIPIALLAVIAPFSVRFSRLAWLHAMYHLNPDPRATRLKRRT